MQNDRNTVGKNDKLCVLLLEDDDADAYLTGRALLSMTRVSQVVRARNGQEAIAMLESEKVVPDIAFVDLQMPTVNGLDFLTSCMNQGLANIPLIVLTSSSDWKDALRSRVNGALYVITKPDSPLDLKQALLEAINAFAPAAPEKDEDQNRISNFGSAEIASQRPTPVESLKSGAPQFGRRQPRL